eukprot:9470205-Pyramimonas_sp.AAC.1
MICGLAFVRDEQKAAAYATLVDISKRVDRVCWRRALRAAAHSGFPAQILQLRQATHYAPRRIKGATSFSYSRQVNRGTPPGWMHDGHGIRKGCAPR